MVDASDLIVALVYAMATAFFGTILGGLAYLLKAYIAVRETVLNLQTRLDRLKAIEDSVEQLGSRFAGGSLLEGVNSLEDLLQEDSDGPERE